MLTRAQKILSHSVNAHMTPSCHNDLSQLCMIYTGKLLVDLSKIKSAQHIFSGQKGVHVVYVSFPDKSLYYFAYIAS